MNNNKQQAVFGGGCFWCTEAVFQNLKGVTEVMSGYAGGHTGKSTYEEVSSGTTGHAEVIRVTFDPEQISYENLLDVFFGTHDPTTLNRQGVDSGTQYRSIILYADDNQKQIAEDYIKKLTDEKVFSSPIVTEIKPLTEFFEAEDYHKNYYKNNPGKSYCQVVIDPKVAKLRQKFSHLLKTAS